MSAIKLLALSYMYSVCTSTSFTVNVTPQLQSLKSNLIMSSNSIGRIQGEVTVESAPLYVRGPPKGFPLIRQRRSSSSTDNSTSLNESSALATRGTNIKKKGKKIKRKGGMMKKIMPYMLVPAMMGIGYAPLLLSKLKMMVMSAFMINMMALNAAIFLTLRNMVFGPRAGEHIKYYNFGYNQKHSHPVHKVHHHSSIDR